MRRYSILFFLFLLPFKLLSEGPVLPWVVYYGDKASPEELQKYNPIVLDSISHPDIKTLIADRRIVLGYIDLSEAEERYKWFPFVKEMDLLIQENPDWPGSWALDLRSPFWTEFVLDKIIPDILSQEFSGIFIDQIDVSIELENRHPLRYQGMTKAAVNLIKAIRKKYPDIYIMLNRGYEILGSVGNDIDFELAETLYTSYDFKTKAYYVRKPEEFQWQLNILNHARFIYPRLTIFSLDYWDPADVEMVKKIYSIERIQGMRPYVATMALPIIVPEPKNKETP